MAVVQAALAELIRNRARRICEYCRLPQEASVVPFEIDHIIALKHRGLTTPENLALACFYCNSSKGPNIAGIDPDTGQVTRLFHPRVDLWSDHFQWSGATLLGRTAFGRTTLDVLCMNDSNMVTLRESLIEEGLFPPPAGDAP